MNGNPRYTRAAVAVFVLAVIIFAVAIALASCNQPQLREFHPAPTLDRVVDELREGR